MEYDIFKSTFFSLRLRQICSYEKKYLRANRASFMTKKVRKAFVVRMYVLVSVSEWIHTL